MDFLTAYSNKDKLYFNRYNSKFTCPKCKKKFPVSEAKVRIVATDTKQVGYESHGNSSTTTYRTSYHKIRYCATCDKKKDVIGYIQLAYFLIPCIVINTLFCMDYFSSPEVLWIGESFWGKVSTRSVQNMIGCIIGIGVAGSTALFLLMRIIQIFIPSDVPTIQEAIDGNSWAGN